VRIGIISDIHEDILSLEGILRAIEKEKVDHVVCLGDILGYDDTHYPAVSRADGDECIRLVKEHCSIAVAGNHDLFAAGKTPVFTAGVKYPPHWHSQSRADRLKFLNGRLWEYGAWEETRRLSATSLDFLRQLPEFAIATYDGTTVHFSHFLYPDLSGSTTKLPQGVHDTWEHLSWMKKHKAMTGFAGHTHLPTMLTGNWYSMLSTARTIRRFSPARTWMTCPPVVAGKTPQGFLTVDTTLREIRTIITG
jgi:predicted phosphodiesterase